MMFYHLFDSYKVDIFVISKYPYIRGKEVALKNPQHTYLQGTDNEIHFTEHLVYRSYVPFWEFLSRNIYFHDNLEIIEYNSFDELIADNFADLL